MDSLQTSYIRRTTPDAEVSKKKHKQTTIWCIVVFSYFIEKISKLKLIIQYIYIYVNKNVKIPREGFYKQDAWNKNEYWRKREIWLLLPIWIGRHNLFFVKRSDDLYPDVFTSCKKESLPDTTI